MEFKSKHHHGYKPLSKVVSYQEYDSKENHALVREHLNSYHIIVSYNQGIKIYLLENSLKISKTHETHLFKDTI